jgi:hypothetical protein
LGVRGGEPPNPGSDEAIAMGCTCPVIDNCHGRGYMGVEGVFVYMETCPLHGHLLRRESDKEGEC